MIEKLLRLNIQFFAAAADDTGGSNDEEETSVGSDASDEPETQTDEQPINDGADDQTKQPDTFNMSKEELDEYVKSITSGMFEEKEKQKEKESMTPEERAAAELAELKAENERLKQEQLRAGQEKLAATELKKNGLTTDSAVMKILAQAEEADTIKAVEAYAAAVKEEAARIVKDKLRGSTPKRPDSDKSTGLTKDDIFAIRDHEARQKAIAENIHLFE